MRKLTALKRKRRALYAKRRNRGAKLKIVLTSAVIFTAFYFLFKVVMIPTVSALSSRSTDLENRDIYTVLAVQKDEENLVKEARVLLIQKKDRKLYSINIDPETTLDLPGRFGKEKYKDILRLARLVGEGSSSMNLLSQSTKKLLEIAIDRYIALDSQHYQKLNLALSKKSLELFLPWELNSMLTKGETSLSVGDMLSLLLFTRGLDDISFEYLDLSQIADWNLKIRDITLNSDIAKESVGVVILNGTGKPNIAKQASQALQNMGIRVSLTDNAENEYEKSYLIVEDPSLSTVSYIKSYYPEVNIVSKARAKSLGELLLDRGDICLILGFDILERTN